MEEQQPVDFAHRDALVEEYREYVRSVVAGMIKAMALPSSRFEDFVSAGYLGLVEAANRFVPKPGFEFKHYAFLRIRGAVIDSIRSCSDLSRSAYKRARAFEAANELRAEAVEHTVAPRKQREASEELHEIFEYASHTVLAHRLTMADCESEMAEDREQQVNPEAILTTRQRDKILRQIVATLPEKERLVLEAYYFKEMSFSDIARQHAGLSKSWVSRLHFKALAAVKQRLLEAEKDPPEPGATPERLSRKPANKSKRKRRKSARH